MTFRGVDYYGIEELFTDEERMVRDTVRAFVEEKVLPRVARHFRDGTFPMDLVPELGRLGLLGTAIPGYGCPGLGPVEYGLVC